MCTKHVVFNLDTATPVANFLRYYTASVGLVAYFPLRLYLCRCEARLHIAPHGNRFQAGLNSPSLAIITAICVLGTWYVFSRVQKLIAERGHLSPLFYILVGWVGVGYQRHRKTCRSLRELDNQGTDFGFVLAVAHT